MLVRLVVLALAASTVATGVAVPAGPEAAAAITAVAPNPVTGDDAGEFVVVAFARPTNTTGWTLADSETSARLPNRTLSGRVALSTTPAAVGDRTDHPVVGLRGSLSLSNAGERVTLRADDRTVAALAYPDAPEAERWNGQQWTPLGATDVPVFAAENVSVSGFVLPDAPGPPLSVVESAESRLYLAGYTFTSERVTAALLAAADRGVDVRVLVEGGVAGGMSIREARKLTALTAGGVDVRVIDGPRSRYSFHHAKYAVADGRAVVLSENWKPAGTGGHGSRGWGVTLRDDRVADHLARVFRADAGWADAKPWQSIRGNVTLVESSPAAATYPTRFPPVSGTADSVRVLVAPDNARRGVRRLVAAANHTLLVEQVRIDPESAFLNWTVAAARRGVRVRVLLSGRWYVESENRNVTRRLNRLAAAEGLDLRARLVDPRSRFAKVHVKGAIVDGERVLVGSLNWNEHAATENREVAVIVEDARIARYYAYAFRADWRGGAWRLPPSLAVVVAGVAVAVAVSVRRLEFEAEGGE